MVQVILAPCAVFIAAAVHTGLHGHILCRNLDVLTGGDIGCIQAGIAACRRQDDIAACGEGGAILRGGELAQVVVRVTRLPGAVQIKRRGDRAHIDVSACYRLYILRGGDVRALYIHIAPRLHRHIVRLHRCHLAQIGARAHCSG